MADVPLVSVGVPVYNGALTIARALDALLAQDLDDIEIIVCDNASDDATPEICAEYAARDSRIRLVRNPRNLGLAANYNRTFELSRGAYFKWATHDDWHAPESLRLTAKALDENPTASLCTTGVSLVDERGIEFDRWIPPADLEDPAPHVRMRRLLRSLGETHPMYGLLRSSVLRRTHLMQSYVGSDRTLLAELSLLGPFVQIPDIMHFYTVSASARRDYRPSLTYDPANAARLPMRTWRLIYEHLGVVRRANLSPDQKVFLAGSVLRRFGIGDARRLAAEAYHTARILAWRVRPSRRRQGGR
jgi:glycosyltransferase involved in cell wall biosynthesis